MSASSWTIRAASNEDIPRIVNITNEAFMADAFFKKEEYIYRFTEIDVKNMMASPNSVFLTSCIDGDVVGSLYLEWSCSSKRVLCGKFSAVSVPPRWGKKGMGRGLVTAAEEYLLCLHKDYASKDVEFVGAPVIFEMGVVNLREDLFKWYQSQGFEVAEDVLDDPEFGKIVKEGMGKKVFCVMMRKHLA